MARNIVKTRDYSFRGVKREGIDYRTKTALVFAFCLVVTLQLTAQYIAYAFGNHPALGGSLFTAKGYRLYPFYRSVYWLYILMSGYKESTSHIAATSSFIFAAGLITSAFASKQCYLKGKGEGLELLHGSAHWATMKEIRNAGLLDEKGRPFSEGVVVGGVKVGKEARMMRHNGREHILCYAPTRSGKGISLVLPTLLDGWRESVFVLDIKNENCSLSAGYRSRELGQKILKLDFTDPEAISKGTSATFNPLEEIRLDFTFKAAPANPTSALFKLIPSGTNDETATIQQIISIIIDPNGKGLADHWGATRFSMKSADVAA